MPIIELTPPTRQQKIIELTPPTAQIEQPTVEQQPTTIDKTKQFFRRNALAETADALTTVGSSIVGDIAGGIAGAGAALLPGEQGEGARVAETVSSAIAQQPRTAGGEGQVQTLGDFIEKGIDIINFPISGIGGLIELATGQGVDQAVATVQAVQEDGVGKTAGSRVLEETGSPLAATIAETAPTAALLATPLKGKPGVKPKISPERAAQIEETIATGGRTGVEVLTSDVLPPVSATTKLFRGLSEKVPFVGTGGKRAQQQTARIDAVKAIDDATPVVTSDVIMNDLIANVNKTKQAAGKRLETVRGEMDQLGVVPVENTVKRINEALAKLEAPGKIRDEALITNLKQMKETALESGNSFSTLRDFRTDARTIVEAVDPLGRSQMSSTNKVLANRVLEGVTKDLDSFVLNNAGERGLTRYKAADSVYRQEALALTKSRLKNVLDKGEIKPELVNNLLRSSSPSEVKLLHKNLSSKGRQNARNSLLRDVIDKSTTKGEISVEKFLTNLDKMEKNLDVFFRGKPKAELNALKKMLQETRRADAAGVATPTGQQLVPLLMTGTAGAGLAGSPIGVAITGALTAVGGAGRLFESATFRDILLRNAKKTGRKTLDADVVKALPAITAELERTLESQ